MTVQTGYVPNAPRWITTEAGEWAWHTHLEWRTSAAKAMSVQQRQALLHEAELLRQAFESAAQGEREIAVAS